jgi:hypothetical protein
MLLPRKPAQGWVWRSRRRYEWGRTRVRCPSPSWERGCDARRARVSPVVADREASSRWPSRRRQRCIGREFSCWKVYVASVLLEFGSRVSEESELVRCDGDHYSPRDSVSCPTIYPSRRVQHVLLLDKCLSTPSSRQQTRRLVGVPICHRGKEELGSVPRQSSAATA